MEKTFIDICYELKVSEKLIHVVEDKYLTYFSSQCIHMKPVLLQIIATEFIEASCRFVNKILYRKIKINSDNYLYKTAQRMSAKYLKKRNKTMDITDMNINENNEGT